MKSGSHNRIGRIGPAAALLLTSLISAGTAAAQGAGNGLPDVIDSCYYQKPPSKDKFCQSWIRNGDKFEQIGGGNAGIVSAEHFDGATATFNQAGASGTQTYTGRISGNHIDGTVTFVAKETGTSLKWSATFFKAPTAATAPAGHIYVACADKVSVVNTATHAVNTVSVKDGAKSIGALTVSPDSSTAYVTTNDPQWKADLFVINGNSGTITRTVPLQGTPLAAGATSLAISGDGSTLFGVGITKSVAIAALDASSGAVKSTQPLPKGYSGGQMVMNPRLVVSGTALVLDDGSIADAVPGGAVYGSDSHGMASFPDGQKICSPNGVLLIGSKTRQAPKGCSAISPDGVTSFQGNTQLRSDFGTAESNPDFGAVVGMLGKAVASSSDGTTLYTLIGSNLYTVDTSSHLTTDAIRVCESPELLGAAPLRPQAASLNATAPAPPSVSPPANTTTGNSGGSDPGRVVAEIEGKPMTARQALDLLKNVLPQVLQTRAGDLPALVQQLYMQHAIAQESLKLHLDKEKPWVDQITQAYGQTIGRFPPPRTNNVPPQVTLSYNNERERILWNAYFTRAGDADERKALLKQKQEEYRITVRDESFFKQPN